MIYRSGTASRKVFDRVQARGARRDACSRTGSRLWVKTATAKTKSRTRFVDSKASMPRRRPREQRIAELPDLVVWAKSRVESAEGDSRLLEIAHVRHGQQSDVEVAPDIGAKVIRRDQLAHPRAASPASVTRALRARRREGNGRWTWWPRRPRLEGARLGRLRQAAARAGRARTRRRIR